MSLNPVTDLQATPGVITPTIQLTWTDPARGLATGYNIYNYDDDSLVANIPWGTTNIVSVTSLEDNTEYSYYIVTTDGTDESGISNIATARTLDIPSLLDPKANFVTLNTVTPSVYADSASGTVYMVLITDPVAIPSADQIKAGLNGFNNAVTNENLVVTLGGTQTFTTIVGLSERTDYSLYFVQENAGGHTSEIAFIDFDTLKNVADVEATFPTDDGGVTGTAFDYWAWDDDYIDFIGWDDDTVMGTTIEVQTGSVPETPTESPGGINPT